MKRLIQLVDRPPLDRHRALGAAARGRDLDRATDAGRRVSGSHRAHGHDSGRRATGWRPRRWSRSSRSRSKARSTAASGVRRVRSATAVGVGVVWVEFDWGTDIYIARQLVAEKLALVAGTLPPQVERPVLAPISSIMGEILFFALSSETADPLTMRTLADTVVRRRLLAVPGVSQVTPIGGAERQFQVIADPQALASQRRVADRAARRGAWRERERVGGHLHRRRRRSTCCRRSAGSGTPRRLATASSLCAAPDPVLVRDVADVHEGAALKRGEGSRSGKPAVIVGVQKQPDANTIEVTDAARSRARRAPTGAAGGNRHRPADLPSGGLHPGRGQQRRSPRCATAAFSSSSSCSCSSPTCARPRSR